MDFEKRVKANVGSFGERDEIGGTTIAAASYTVSVHSKQTGKNKNETSKRENRRNCDEWSRPISLSFVIPSRSS
jgi:hypothetical protein